MSVMGVAGVPQGTKLGPIAFQAVINDAAVDGTAHYWKYVDDLTFAKNRISSELSNLQGDLDDFLDWSVTNQLKLKGCGIGPWLVLVSPCFRENVVPTCKIGSFFVLFRSFTSEKRNCSLF